MTTKKLKPIVCAIAGSDCSGGAGVQADNQVIQAFNCFATNIITAVTAQNSQSVSAIESSTLMHAQWQALQQEYPADVFKLGMLGSAATVRQLTELLSSNQKPVICDPVLQASNGGDLIEKSIDNSQAYIALLQHVDVLIPNQQEFQRLFTVSFTSAEQLQEHALQISQQFQLNLIITGGESQLNGQQAADLCVINGQCFWMLSPMLASNNTHGTGCSFSSAYAAAIACGYEDVDAAVLAKAYINQALANSVAVNHVADAKGPLAHAGLPRTIDYLPTIAADNRPPLTVFPAIHQQLGAYPVVDTIAWLEKCLIEGIKTIQLRVKDKTELQLDELVAAASRLGREYGARLFINDYWQLAIKHQAYGVHLGHEDLDSADTEAINAAGLHLGISTHSWFEIARAHGYRPSYIAIGPIYATTTKTMRFAPQGLTQLKQWIAMIGDRYPVVAIGGIDLSNAEGVLSTGVGSVAMVRAITEAEDYRQAAADFQHLFNRECIAGDRCG